MNCKYCFVAVMIFFSSALYALPTVKYTLGFEEPQTHYIKVKMEISNWSEPVCRLKLPVWTPGSYMVREYSRYLEQFKVYDAKQSLTVSRFRKNGWEVKTGSTTDFTVEYYIYAYDLTVRTAFVDVEHAYFNGAAVFLYMENFKNISSTVKINPFKDWKKLSVALDPVNADQPWIVSAPDYDALIDAPFEIGNHDVFSFTAAGIKHEMAMFGKSYFDSTAIKNDLIKIIEEETKIFGENPCRRYLFIVHQIPVSTGGLEHRNSATLQVVRNAMSTPSGYNSFISLAAHEYFHIWNIKRLHPSVLTTFDYDNEIYTSLLFFAEGFTAYYSDMTTVRIKMVKPENYLKTLMTNISTVENTPGNKIQSLAEAGYDAWIKYYSRNENSSNSTISYYSKGNVMGAMLDLLIIDATNGKSGLDDVMKYMYNQFYVKKNTGFTDAELISSVEKICDCNMKSFFQNYIYDTKTIPYDSIFLKAGIKMTNSNKNPVPYSGFNFTNNNGKITVSGVERNSPAWKGGLNVNDEILAINDNRVIDDPQKIISSSVAGDIIRYLVNRSGRIKEVLIVIENSGKVSYEPTMMEDPDEKMKIVYNKWLNNN
ncbi:MAG: PDZ domain-containing protein [Bacteroidota bacterium]